MEKEDVEILDIEDLPSRSNRNNEEFPVKENKHKEENDLNIKEENKNKKVKKEKKVKDKTNLSKGGKTICLIIIILTVLLVSACGVYYGNRLLKYYRLYNPKPTSGGEKVQLLSDYIVDHSEIKKSEDMTDGIFATSGAHIYKGKDVNNYLKYNNMLWRIVRINTDGSIILILDENINVLSFNKEKTTFDKSELQKYLNNEFYNILDQSYLVNNSYCSDDINTLSMISCNNQNTDSYVTLLDVSSYLNTLRDGKSYINDEEEVLWLSNASDDKIWHTNGYNVSVSESGEFYEIKPVVRLKSIINYKSGNGTKENPYLIESNSNFGKIIELGNDKYIIIETNDKNYKLMSLFNLDKTIKYSNSNNKFDITEKDNIGYYLNNTYKDSLSYKDLLIENDYYIGEYKDSFNDIKNDSVKTYIGIPNMLDIKFDSSLNNYYLSTYMEKNMIVYGKDVFFNSPKISRNIRTVITISNDIKLNGNGTLEDPYKVVD